MRSIQLGWFLTLAAVAVTSFVGNQAFADDSKHEHFKIREALLHPTDDLELGETSAAFTIVLSELELRREELLQNRNLAAKERSEQMNRIEHLEETILEAYDKIVNIAPISWGMVLQFAGSEVALPFVAHKKLFKFGPAGLQGSVGVLVTKTKKRATGENEWAYGLASLVGPYVQVGLNPSDTRGLTRPQGGLPFFLGVTVITPGRGDAMYRKAGDLQGWYPLGGAIDGKVDWGNLSSAPVFGSFGYYGKWNGFALPDVGLWTLQAGKGGLRDASISPQYEALALVIHADTDESKFRNPLPFTSKDTQSWFNSARSQHSSENRAAKRKEELKKLLENHKDVTDQLNKLRNTPR